MTVDLPQGQHEKPPWNSDGFRLAWAAGLIILLLLGVVYAAWNSRQGPVRFAEFVGADGDALISRHWNLSEKGKPEAYTWVRSTDGGRTWTVADGTGRDREETGRAVVCVPGEERHCFRIVAGKLRVEETTDGLTWRTAWEITDEERSYMGRTGEEGQSIALAEVPGGGYGVAVANDRDGLVVRTPDGVWSRIGHPATDSSPPRPIPTAEQLAEPVSPGERDQRGNLLAATWFLLAIALGARRTGKRVGQDWSWVSVAITGTAVLCASAGAVLQGFQGPAMFLILPGIIAVGVHVWKTRDWLYQTSRWLLTILAGAALAAVLVWVVTQFAPGGWWLTLAPPLAGAIGGLVARAADRFATPWNPS